VITRCPSCKTGQKGTGMYLCYDCWGQLRLPVRRALKRTDMQALSRLQDLYDQIHEGVPLTEISVSP
jgi:hypothetical protein